MMCWQDRKSHVCHCLLFSARNNIILVCDTTLSIQDTIAWSTCCRLISLSLFFFLSLSFYLSLSFSPSFSVFLHLCLSLWIFVFVYSDLLFLSLSFTDTHKHTFSWIFQNIVMLYVLDLIHDWTMSYIRNCNTHSRQTKLQVIMRHLAT